ncbi:hypothetical protein L7F22_031699 [Adiantum nelumboides]|nr:hypothetical protein [Adiantum nelumboides]
MHLRLGWRLEFKQLFAALWLTLAFEVDILTKWHRLRLKRGQSIQNYNQKYWEAYYPVACFRQVKLQDQFEIYCCGLPKKLKRYCIKQKASSIQSMMAHVEDGFGLLKGDMTYKDDSSDEEEQTDFLDVAYKELHNHVWKDVISYRSGLTADSFMDFQLVRGLELVGM